MTKKYTTKEQFKNCFDGKFKVCKVCWCSPCQCEKRALEMEKEEKQYYAELLRKDNNESIKRYIRADLRLAKIQSALILIATALLALISVLYAFRVISKIKIASAKSVTTTATVIETRFNSDVWEKFESSNEIIFYRV